MQVPPCHWSRNAFDETIKNDHITNSMIKSFNSQLGAYRQKLILTLLEHIRRKVMKRLQKRHQKCNNCMIHPIPDQAMWPEVECDKLLSPYSRRRQLDEEIKDKRSFTIKCGLCKGLGHNKRSCNHAFSRKKRAKTMQVFILHLL